MEIVRYEPRDASEWNTLVAQAVNATFLHDRHYMDYHADRFTDHSLVIKDTDGTLVAAFPASQHEDTIVSHGGLTYGGLLCMRKNGAKKNIDIFKACVEHYKAQGFKSLRYKPLPHIYQSLPCDDDLYALFILGARCVRTDISTTISLDIRPPYSKGKKYNLSKARKAGLTVSRTPEFKTFFDMVSARLEEKYSVRPTHTAEEMTLLHQRFPEKIQLFNCYNKDNQLLAGVLIYDCGHCVHAQYMASTESGRENGALDLAVDAAIQHYADRRYFDFGISTEQQGRYLNEGLIRQKELFGGTSTVYQVWELDL